MWEERFERRYGFWQGRWDRAVAAYLDCGLFESGFAVVRCPVCKAEYHVAFSCRCRGLCPSCSAKRVAIFSELLEHRILADVPHAQWVFSIPKMLRPYFLYRRSGAAPGVAGAGGPTMVQTNISIDGKEFMRAITPAFEDATKRRVTRVHPVASNREF